MGRIIVCGAGPKRAIAGAKALAAGLAFLPWTRTSSVAGYGAGGRRACAKVPVLTARRRSMQPPKKISRRLARAGTPAGRAGLLPVPPTLSSGPLCHWARRPGFCYKRLRQSLRARRYAPLFAFFSRNWPSCASAKLRVGCPWYR